MEETLKNLSKNLGNFTNNLQSTCLAFKKSLDRRPIPLDSASTTFMRSMNERVTSLTTDLNLLDSMAFGTVSFEELLGHCNQIYQQNHSQLVEIHSRLQSLGVISLSDGIDDLEEDVMSQVNYSSEPESDFLTSNLGIASRNLEDDPLFDEPPGLQNLGLSDICMATLASGGNTESKFLDSPPKLRSLEFHPQATPHIVATVGALGGNGDEDKKCGQASKVIVVSDDDYEGLPSYMKSLAPWTDLQSAVEKMNSFLSKKGNSLESNFFHPEELESMGLGPKGRSYLLLLVRMNRLVVETNAGLITYRVL